LDLSCVRDFREYDVDVRVGGSEGVERRGGRGVTDNGEDLVLGLGGLEILIIRILSGDKT